MMNTGNRLTKIFAVTVTASFLWVAFLLLFKGIYYIDISPLVTAAGCLAVLGFFFLLDCFSEKISFRRPVRAEILLLALYFAVYIALQFYTAAQLRTVFAPSWDFGIVAGEAAQYALEGVLPSSYFSLFPNNTPLLILLIGLFRVFHAIGINDPISVGIVFNIVMIDAAIFVTYLTAKKVSGRRNAAFFAILMMFLTLPLLAYTPIFYTDTLTMIFPVSAFRLWLSAKDRFGAGNCRAGALWTAFAVLLTAAGGLLKISVLIALIAIVIDALLSYPLRRSAIAAAVAAIVFSAAYFPASYALKHTPLLPEARPEEHIPYTHWIMMGLHGHGDYHQEDYDFTLGLPPAEREEAVRAEILRRLQEYGIGGLLQHQADKTSFVWSDGTYFTFIKTMRDRAYGSWLDNYIIYTGSEHFTYAAACRFIQLAYILAFPIAGLFLFFGKRKEDKALRVFLLAVFGLFLFQNIWEARSRYLLNFLPVFAVLGGAAYRRLFSAARFAAKKVFRRGKAV